MADPFAELDTVVHAQLGTDFTIDRTSDTVRICIDESPGENEYGGARGPSVQIIGEILSIDYSKVREGDYLTNGETHYKIIEIMPPVDGSKDLYLKKV